MVGMTDIAQFLAARLDEDERGATAAAEKSGRGRGLEPGEPVHWRASEGDVYLDGGYGSCIATGPYEGSIGDHEAAHIARHDPARVLAEVKAKRALLKCLEADVDGCTDDAEWRGASTALDRVLEYLAAPYADHPNYDPAWRVPTTEEN